MSPAEIREAVQIAAQTGPAQRQRSLFVACDDGAVVGFAVTGVTDEQDGPRGDFDFLLFEPANRAAGQLLVEAGERWIRDRGRRRVLTFDHGYPVYRFAYSPLTCVLGHVGALLRGNGYEPAGSWVFMLADRLPASVTVPHDLDVAVVERPGDRGGPTLAVHLSRSQSRLGICETYGGPTFGGAAELEDLTYVGNIRVYEEVDRSAGLGAVLMEVALVENARRFGVRRAALHTGSSNWRAQLFYGKHGFAHVDVNFKYSRNLP